jgi:predicted membrane protein
VSALAKISVLNIHFAHIKVFVKHTLTFFGMGSFLSAFCKKKKKNKTKSKKNNNIFKQTFLKDIDYTESVQKAL